MCVCVCVMGEHTDTNAIIIVTYSLLHTHTLMCDHATLYALQEGQQAQTQSGCFLKPSTRTSYEVETIV